MIRNIIILLLTCACAYAQAQVNIITTIAGTGLTGVGGYSGDGGAATDAQLYIPSGVCLDKCGNIFIADAFNHRVRRIDASTSIITTIAGTGIGGYNGDSIPATSAELYVPASVFADTSGNVYIADGLNNRIRKVTVSTGIITTIAGNGAHGSDGDEGQATNAMLGGPVGVCLDNFGNIYIADYDNNKIRKVDNSTGIITTIAGNGIAGYDGDNIAATNAEINGTADVYLDHSGNIYITDQWNYRVRKVDKVTGIITTIAGNGTAGYSGDNGAAVDAQLNQPTGMFVDNNNNIFVAEYANATVRRIDALSGIITTVAGTGVRGFSGDGGAATNAQLRCEDIFVDTFGSIYIADYENNRIRKVFNPQLAVATQNISNNAVKLYPNPAQNNVVVECRFASSEDGVIQITDVTGRVVVSEILSSQKQKEEIDVSNLSQGMYLYKVLQNNILISTGKIVKE